MKKLIPFFALLLCMQITVAQNKKPKPNTSHPVIVNIKYPKTAQDNNIQGTVILIMDIDSTCALINRKVLSGLGYGCDEAALGALTKYQAELKKQTKSTCKPVKNFKMPIKFSLD